MPEPADQPTYLNAAELVVRILGQRILKAVYNRSKTIQVVRRDWKDDDPRRRGDVLFVRDEASVTFFEYSWVIPRLKITADYARALNIAEIVTDVSETIDRTVQTSLVKDAKIEDCTFYSRPFPDPTAEMAQFGLQGRFATVNEHGMGLSMLLGWDPESLSPAVWLRFLCCAYTPRPWLTSAAGAV